MLKHQIPEGMKPGIADRLEVLRTLDELVALRIGKGISQATVAQAIGISQSAVSQFEREAGSVRVETMQRYARAIGARVHIRVQDRLVLAAPAPVRGLWKVDRASAGWAS